MPKFSYGNYLRITADCEEGSVGHCANIPTYVEPEVCAPGFVQVSYDKCCESIGSVNCQDFTAPPTKSPTAAPTFGSESNLVTNPGFEDETNGWSARGNANIEVDDTEKHSGFQSVLVTDRSATWKGITQNMPHLLANSKYRVSCWTKLKGEVSSQRLSLGFQIEDDGGTHYNNVYGTINNETWTKVEGDITVDVAGALSEVWMYASGLDAGVEYWVDDFVVIERIAPPTASPTTAAPTKSPTAAPTFDSASNLAANPDFEDGTDGWRARGSGASIAIDDTEQHSGSQSLLVTERSAKWKGMYQNMLGNLLANNKYRVSCWAKVKGDVSSQQLTLGFQINDEYGQHYQDLYGAINNERWTKIEGDLTIEATGSLTQLSIYTAGLDVGVEYWVDNFFVALVSD